MPDTPFDVALPAGGTLHLQTEEEVEMWETTSERYQEDYALTKTNDLVLLGALLTQQLALFRAQQKMNGMEPELDANDLPTGNYKRVEMKATQVQAAQTVIVKASTEIRELEKTLGIDKKTRDQGGAQTVAGYIQNLKLAGREYGIHISKRTLAFEAFVNELRTKVRVLRNADAEDRAYEGISEDSILTWAEGEMAKLEEVDKRFAREKGKLFVGRL